MHIVKEFCIDRFSSLPTYTIFLLGCYCQGPPVMFSELRWPCSPIVKVYSISVGWGSWWCIFFLLQWCNCGLRRTYLFYYDLAPVRFASHVAWCGVLHYNGFVLDRKRGNAPTKCIHVLCISKHSEQNRNIGNYVPILDNNLRELSAGFINQVGL